MAFVHKPEIRKQIDQGNAYFTVWWSPLTKADKYDIIRSVPSIAGVFELYYMDHKNKLNLFFVAKAWYGGLRNSIRKLTDPELERNPARRQVLNTYDCYFRFSCSESNDDMTDVLFFFSRTYFPNSTKMQHSGRYLKIFVEEESPDKLVTI